MLVAEFLRIDPDLLAVARRRVAELRVRHVRKSSLMDRFDRAAL